MDEWQTISVAELQRNNILLVEDGNHGEYRPRPDEFVGEGTAFIRAADMNHGRVLFDSASKINETARLRITKGIGAPGDVLLSHKGTVGKLARVPLDAPPFVCSPQTTFWRSLNPNKLDQGYLHTFLRSPVFKQQLASRSGETDMAPYVSLTAQRALLVTVPPIDVQRNISHAIGALDAKLELNRQMNETLDACARTVFLDWFVDFGPTRAKIEGRMPYLSPEIWSLFPERLNAEGLPEGWESVELLSLCSDLRRGISPSYVETGGVRVLNQKCIRARTVSITPARRHDDSVRSVEGRLIQAGDILVNSTGVGTLGRVGQIWTINEPTVADSHVTVVRADLHKISAEYLGLNLTGRENEIEALGEGSTGQTELSRERLGRLDVVVPSSTALDAVSDVVSPLVRRANENATESQTLMQLRDLLLPRLMSGEIRLREAEKQVEDAV